jgi:hypothetical protein
MPITRPGCPAGKGVSLAGEAVPAENVLMPSRAPSPIRRLLPAALLVLAGLGLPDGLARAATGSPPTASAAQEKPHKHTFVKKSRKVWIPPEVKRVKVGTDQDGKPIYKNQVVKPGYYKTVYYYACSCGVER